MDGAVAAELPTTGAANLTIPDPAEIARALGVLFEPNDVVELRAISTRGRKRTDAGY